MEPKDLPPKYKKIWEKCIPYFKECRFGIRKREYGLCSYPG